MLRWRESRVDEPAAHELLSEYFADRAAGFPAAQGLYRTTFPVAEDFIEPRGVFLIAVDESDSPLGCGGIRLLESVGVDGLRYEVKHLYLRPDARGRGLGRALLAELEERARGFGATELVLDTNASLAAAGGLYRSSGYSDIPPYNENPNATNWYRKAL
ncbi:GNAT family N-acetyltransferase [Frigoribacterium sp. UYMn621]|jgi:GNAT superfamily N-acetyltransferase|uniref:GNAT family N-acetyltransferase n=1 Tax=Frigoribacterium sp. UYMn621 TaxID=3156343 RepID=UPI00339AB15E